MSGQLSRAVIIGQTWHSNVYSLKTHSFKLIEHPFLRIICFLSLTVQVLTEHLKIFVDRPQLTLQITGLLKSGRTYVLYLMHALLIIERQAEESQHMSYTARAITSEQDFF